MKRWRNLDRPSQSPDLSLTDLSPPGEDQTKGRETPQKQELKEAAVKLWEKITREGTESLLTCVSQRPQSLTAKNFSLNIYDDGFV